MSCDRPARHADWPGTRADGCRPKYAQIGDGPLMAVYWEYEESTVVHYFVWGCSVYSWPGRCGIYIALCGSVT